MNDRPTAIVAPLGRWSSRIAVFSASLMLIDVVLHRLTPFPTPVAVNLFAVSAAGAGLAILVGLVAFIQIWRRGYKGAGSAAVGILLPLFVLAWPLTFLPALLKQPALNDVTTDWAAPPRFVELAKQRTDGANPAAYPAERFAVQQQKAYPDLRTFVMDRSLEETFELVEEVVRKLRWKVAIAEPPVGKPAKGGRLEATDQTLLAGFTDDVVIRVEGAGRSSRVDVRSASRYGTHDLGQNAIRVRRFLTELQARVDSTAPAAVAGRRALRTTRAGTLVKRPKERDQKKAESRSGRDRAQSSAQRARGQKETQR
jgi:uncharacterized protein (DUF1499 family)